MLETIWFAIWGIAWAVYFMLDGFDLGIGSLLPFIARKEEDRRIAINAMGPFWDGNEVWLITAGGVTFAAFPRAYALMFSGLYTPLMLLLFALILRGVAFEFRGKIDSDAWRRVWDGCLIVGSVVPALLLGVAFANIFAGIPLDDAGIFRGNLFTLLNPYGLIGGILFVLAFALHGALWLAARTQGDLGERASSAAQKLWPVVLVTAVVFLATTWWLAPLWQNLLQTPVLLAIPLLAVAGLVGIYAFLRQRHYWRAWFSSSVFLVAAVLFGVSGMFPNLLLSSLSPSASITVHNSCSSPLTLQIMLGVVVCFLPVVIGYQIWTYLTFRHPLNVSSLEEENMY
jgi:cytochrome bd ubiquinol oxidase subunit II